MEAAKLEKKTSQICLKGPSLIAAPLETPLLFVVLHHLRALRLARDPRICPARFSAQ